VEDGADLGAVLFIKGNDMIIAGVVIQTLPGQGPDVAMRLTGVEGLSLRGGDGEDRIAAVWSAETAESLESLAESLVKTDESILGVFPVFIGDDAA
jgi:nitrate reductase NapAB chaperone NapD